MAAFALLILALMAPPADWDAVKALQPGITVRVEPLDGGREIQGRLIEATDTSVVVEADGTRSIVPLETIRQVARVQGRAKRLAIRGFLVGAAGGALLGAATVKSNRGVWAASLALGWGAIGSMIGALAGAGDQDVNVVYRRP
jgi:hypothetical protein